MSLKLKDCGTRQTRDIRYPGMTGEQILSLAREADPKLPAGVIPTVRLASGQTFRLSKDDSIVFPIEILPDASRVPYIAKGRGKGKKNAASKAAPAPAAAPVPTNAS